MMDENRVRALDQLGSRPTVAPSGDAVKDANVKTGGRNASGGT